jgi:hypothetical protein
MLSTERRNGSRGQNLDAAASDDDDDDDDII